MDSHWHLRHRRGPALGAGPGDGHHARQLHHARLARAPALPRSPRLAEAPWPARLRRHHLARAHRPGPALAAELHPRGREATSRGRDLALAPDHLHRLRRQGPRARHGRSGHAPRHHHHRGALGSGCARGLHADRTGGARRPAAALARRCLRAPGLPIARPAHGLSWDHADRPAALRWAGLLRRCGLRLRPRWPPGLRVPPG